MFYKLDWRVTGLASYFRLLGSSHPMFELTVKARRDSYNRLARRRNSQARTMLQFAIPSPAVPFAHGSAVTHNDNSKRQKMEMSRSPPVHQVISARVSFGMAKTARNWCNIWPRAIGQWRQNTSGSLCHGSNPCEAASSR